MYFCATGVVALALRMLVNVPASTTRLPIVAMSETSPLRTAGVFVRTVVGTSFVCPGTGCSVAACALGACKAARPVMSSTNATTTETARRRRNVKVPTGHSFVGSAPAAPPHSGETLEDHVCYVCRFHHP